MKFLLFIFSIQVSCFIVNACTTGEIRLVNGDTPNQGRVEICINKVWGTVCDDSWNYNNARVVCRQLGYSTDGATYSSGLNGYGQGTGAIFLDEVQCSGNQCSLLDCPQNLIGDHNCGHSEDVGVSCSSLPDTSTCPSTSTIIASSTNSFCEPPSSSPCNCPSFPSPFESSYQSSSEIISTYKECPTTTPLASVVFTITTTLTLSVTATTTEAGTIASAVDNCTASVTSAIILPVLLLIIIAILLMSLTLVYYYKIRKSDNKNESKLERKGTLLEVSNASVYGDLKPPDGNDDGMVYSPMYNSASIANSVESVPLDAIGSNRYHTSNNRVTDIPQYEMTTAAYEYVDNEPAYDRPSNDNKNRSVSNPYETIPGEEDEVTYESPDAGALRT
ncbi:PREDICTED: uncharacterized protein LOC109581053 isoform X2 [Amphimedon queenslandica]|uniref:SRCR domain-containing protein n=1 Tax=Amphimedon queenslandica TaxID=400682 RepID=A0AAN0J0T9_AMPQE|nr:PREDICTED: uncharacterized protein LOC109581053 isoform X2 [Amphimedon queenslandica]|eukprot:XP_019850362.1 PREDICTED: uncharacterized protein LOC109581053 isoform X2 [Amphimedon queenslandica]